MKTIATIVLFFLYSFSIFSIFGASTGFATIQIISGNSISMQGVYGIIALILFNFLLASIATMATIRLGASLWRSDKA